ncbi:MAG: methyltransferase domain-containing protein [Candidatus Omnitrophota bacterium]
MTDNKTLLSRLKLLRCPACKAGALDIAGGTEAVRPLHCRACGKDFAPDKGYYGLLGTTEVSGPKGRIQRFWGDTCREWYSGLDEVLTADILEKHLAELTKMFVYRKHCAVTEMAPEGLAGADILEIGSGPGAHSALFKKRGANVTAIDITEERVLSTGKKLALVKEGTGFSVLADAENLPFRDDSFDIVYSNGVLHHSEDTAGCVSEVYRVLKPGGKAVIMLYCRDSLLYWMNLLPKTLINGSIFRMPEPERLGYITEGRPGTGARNPITRVYSKRELEALFGKFRIISLRKSGFALAHIPGGGYLRSAIRRLSGEKPYEGGVIVYGAPFYAETGPELALGRYIGFSWNVVAAKAS